ncbi:hypothetical protein VTP01DRAFT_6722 [Rhizomucor pusillus]|uniref:uncharacterized protein n=1 Tax=Rhizomucor pusillus TaxID=4840 RepID=UPI003744108B
MISSLMSPIDVATPPPFPSNGTGIANLPNQRHKIVAKNGANFTLMVCGESGTGKTTFVNTLFTSTIKEPKNLSAHRRYRQTSKTVQIQITKAELEEKMFKVNLTVIDTPGFGDYVNNRHSWSPIVDFIDEQHDKYMRQEQQPRRDAGVDMRVHACLYFIKPTGHTLSPLDVECMKRLGTRVNLIPVIAKADTLTPADLAKFKQNVRQVIAAQDIQVYSCPVESEDESTTRRNANIMAAMPFAVIGSTQDVVTNDGRCVKGRQYSWGVAEVENDYHCDFRKLRSLLIRTHMLDLICTTEDIHYERYRQTQMENLRFGNEPALRIQNEKFQHEEQELHERFAEQVRKQELRFKEWEQRLYDERDKLHQELEAERLKLKEMQNELELYFQSNQASSPRAARK